MISAALEGYAATVHALIRERGAARVRAVADALAVKMPSVVKAIAELKRRGIVRQEPYGAIELTAAGRRCATRAAERIEAVKACLEKLGVDSRAAAADARKMARGASAGTLARMKEFVARGRGAVPGRKPAAKAKTPAKPAAAKRGAKITTRRKGTR